MSAITVSYDKAFMEARWRAKNVVDGDVGVTFREKDGKRSAIFTSHATAVGDVGCDWLSTMIQEANEAIMAWVHHGILPEALVEKKGSEE